MPCTHYFLRPAPAAEPSPPWTSCWHTRGGPLVAYLHGPLSLSGHRPGLPYGPGVHPFTPSLTSKVVLTASAFPSNAPSAFQDLLDQLGIELEDLLYADKDLLRNILEVGHGGGSAMHGLGCSALGCHRAPLPAASYPHHTARSGASMRIAVRTPSPRSSHWPYTFTAHLSCLSDALRAQRHQAGDAVPGRRPDPHRPQVSAEAPAAVAHCCRRRRRARCCPVVRLPCSCHVATCVRI